MDSKQLFEQLLLAEKKTDALRAFSEFKKTAEFENSIATFTGAKHCIVVNNGTISLTLAAMACGIVAGDEVLVPNFTMIATPNSVKMFGAVPVLVDVEPETLCMDIEKARTAITSKTKAIIMVSANGRYPKAGIDAFLKLAEENDLKLIEDSAQSLGSYYPDGAHVGTKGIVGSFSFSAPKIISTGQGGGLITNDEQVAFRLRRLKDFGRSGGGNDIHDSIGYNFKFTEPQAIIGIEQMKKLPWRIQRKKEIFRQYQNRLQGVSGIKLFDHDLQHTTPWFIDTIATNRESLQNYLKENNIGTRVMYPPINKQVAYNLPGNFPVSEQVGKEGLWLPSSSQLANEQIGFICDKIRLFYHR